MILFMGYGLIKTPKSCYKFRTVECCVDYSYFSTAVFAARRERLFDKLEMNYEVISIL